MNKKLFLSRMNSTDNSLASNIYDKIVLAKKTNKIIYSGEFYTPNIWNNLQEMSNELGIEVYNYGIFQDAERRMVAFSYSEVLDYPIDLIKISVKSKFSKLQHKDYLGSVMALGFRREKLGDFIVKENQCCFATSREISEYIKLNLTSIGKSTCVINVLNTNLGEVQLYDFETIIVNVSSLRIDCVVSALCNISRTKAEELIRQGKVLVNYTEAIKRDKLVKDNSVITVRGYGKFKVVEETGCTGSGRIKILVKKFV